MFSIVFMHLQHSAYIFVHFNLEETKFSDKILRRNNQLVGAIVH